MLQHIPTGEVNQHGANMCDFVDVEITAEITELMTLREALPALVAAWAENTKELGAEDHSYYIESVELLQDTDGVPVLYMGLGT